MRVVIYKKNGTGKIVKDYQTRKEAITAYYELCDSKGYTYGKPTYTFVDKKKVQEGMETNGNDYKINLIF